MTIILTITHSHIGQAMIAAVEQTYGKLSLPTESISVCANSDPDDCFNIAKKIIKNYATHDGCIIFTDMLGATPSNIAHRLHDGKRVFVISGLNLAMLLRVFNYPHLSVEELVQKALAAGREGVTCGC